VREVRTFVRHGGQVVELTWARPLTAGRAEECDLVLDDSQAARQHCRLELQGDRVLVVDLGSRNGVLVNGLRVDGEVEVHHGDIITVGKSQLAIARQAHEPRAPSEEPPRRPRTSSSADRTGTGSVFEILAGGARTSLSDGDLVGAERSTQNLFVALKGFMARRKVTSDEMFAEAIDLALELAERTDDAGWIDRVLELHVAARRTMSSSLAERIVAVSERVGPPTRALGDYLALARELVGDTEPSAEILRRLER
jgi:hypothetical protein